MSEMVTTKMMKVLTKAEKAFGDLPILIHDGKRFHHMGRVSVLEVVEIDMKALVLRVGESKSLEPLGKVLREGQDNDWMQSHTPDAP